MFTPTLVVENAVFLIIIGDWKDFMFWNDKFPDFGNPYNLLEYFSNKDIGWNKTLQKRWYTNGSIKEQPFLNTEGSKLYSSHREKKEGTSMWNSWVLWVFFPSQFFQFCLGNWRQQNSEAGLWFLHHLSRSCFVGTQWLPDIILSQRASS